MKKTLTLIVAALMGFSTSAYVMAAETSEPSSLTEKKPSRKKGEIKEVVFNVHLHCENCVKKVQENIAFEKGVKGLEVSLEKQTVAVKYDAAKTSVETLKAAIQKLNVPVKSVEYPKGK